MFKADSFHSLKLFYLGQRSNCLIDISSIDFNLLLLTELSELLFDCETLVLCFSLLCLKSWFLFYSSGNLVCIFSFLISTLEGFATHHSNSSFRSNKGFLVSLDKLFESVFISFICILQNPIDYTLYISFLSFWVCFLKLTFGLLVVSPVERFRL